MTVDRVPDEGAVADVAEQRRIRHCEASRRWRVAKRIDPATKERERQRKAAYRQRPDVQARIRAYRKAYAAAHPDANARWCHAYKLRRRAAINAAERSRRSLADLLLSNDIYAAAWAAVGRGVPDREDVVSSIVLAVLAGELRPADIKAQAPRFIGRHFDDLGWRRHVDIDGPVPGYDKLRLSETLAASEAMPA